MIRYATPSDSGSVVELAVSSGLFPADDTAVVVKMMADYFEGNIDEGHMCLIDEETEPLGVVYYEPAPATDRAWYLTMIAVRGSHQGQGRGSALLRYVEDVLRAKDQRLLLVETAGTPDFERTRQFYVKCGYNKEARVREYYAVGVDMVLFRKILNAG